jgi:hypothetical protein
MVHGPFEYIYDITVLSIVLVCIKDHKVHYNYTTYNGLWSRNLKVRSNETLKVYVF